MHSAGRLCNMCPVTSDTHIFARTYARISRARAHTHTPFAAREVDDHNGNACRNAECTRHQVGSTKEVVPSTQPGDL